MARGTLCKFYFDSLTSASANQWRWGQAIFNLLLERHPLLAERIRGTHLDPFHIKGPSENPVRWDECVKFIEEHWYIDHIG